MQTLEPGTAMGILNTSRQPELLISYIVMPETLDPGGTPSPPIALTCHGSSIDGFCNFSVWVVPAGYLLLAAFTGYWFVQVHRNRARVAPVSPVFRIGMLGLILFGSTIRFLMFLIDDLGTVNIPFARWRQDPKHDLSMDRLNSVFDTFGFTCFFIAQNLVAVYFGGLWLAFRGASAVARPVMRSSFGSEVTAPSPLEVRDNQLTAKRALHFVIGSLTFISTVVFVIFEAALYPTKANPSKDNVDKHKKYQFIANFFVGTLALVLGILYAAALGCVIRILYAVNMHSNARKVVMKRIVLSVAVCVFAFVVRGLIFIVITSMLTEDVLDLNNSPHLIVMFQCNFIGTEILPTALMVHLVARNINSAARPRTNHHQRAANETPLQHHLLADDDSASVASFGTV